MYTVEEFKNEIQKNGGYEALLAMYFNNSNVKVFGAGEVFNPDVNLDEDTGTVIFFEKDVKGLEIIVTRKLMYLEGMVFAKDPSKRDNIHPHTFRY